MKTKMNTTTLYMLLFSVLLLLVVFSTAQAEGPSYSSTETLTKQINFDYCQYIVCSNEGAGEWVNFAGTNTWVSTIERAGDHVIVSWKLAATTSKGEGLESGESYSSETSSTEFATMFFTADNDDDSQLSIKVNWSGNISTDNNMLSFPLDFTGELRLDLEAKDMGFNFEEINTGCESTYTVVNKQ